MLGSILCFGFSPVCLQTTNMQLYSLENEFIVNYGILCIMSTKFSYQMNLSNLTKKKLPILKLIQIQMNKYYIKLN